MSGYFSLRISFIVTSHRRGEKEGGGHRVTHPVVVYVNLEGEAADEKCF